MTISRTRTEDAGGGDETLPAAESLGFPPGAKVGRFAIEGELGRGGMGVVLAAHDPQLERRVAIKLLRGERGEAVGEWVDREARAMAKLAHPNVVTVFEVGTHEGKRFIAMELVEGETLRHWLEARRRGWREVTAMFIAAGRGLEAAHAQGLIHRDFKPDNVLVGRDGRPRVGDFGLVASRQNQLENSSVMGTPPYMAPEQLDRQVTDERSDQFAFAVSLHEALHGTRPFGGRTMAELREAMAAGRRNRGTASVPAWLTAVIERGLALDPSARWPSMTAMLEALGRDPAARRRRFAVGAVVIGLAGVATWAMLRSAPAIDPCAASDHKVRAAWTPARRQAIVDGFAASGVGYAGAVVGGVVDHLDAAAGAIATARIDACRATRTRGEQSETLLDARMACLDRHLGGLTAVADLLAHPDKRAIDGAPDAVADLGDLDDCADTGELAALPPEPDDPALRAALAALRDQLAALAETSSLVGSKDAVATSEVVLAEARRIGYCPELARALALRGGALGNNAADQQTILDGEALLRDAIHEADSCRADRIRGMALLSLASFLENPDPTSAERLEVVAEAEAVFHRLGDGRKEADLIALEMTIADAQGQPALAVALGESALLLVESAGRTDIALTFNLGIAHMRHGDVARAEELVRAALAQVRDALGPDHPEVAQMEQGLAMILGQRDDAAGAIASLEDALRIQRAAFGPEHRQVLISRANLAGALIVADRNAEARVELEALLPLVRKVFGPDHDLVINTLSNLAIACRGVDDLTHAVEYERQALELDARIKGADHHATAVDHSNLAGMEADAGDWAAARADARVAVVSIEKLESGSSPTLGHALITLGQAEVHLGDKRQGLADLDRARAIFVADDDQEEIANIDELRAALRH